MATVLIIIQSESVEAQSSISSKRLVKTAIIIKYIVILLQIFLFCFVMKVWGRGQLSG